jgi:hypothetical protein
MTPAPDPGARLAADRLQLEHPAWLIPLGQVRPPVLGVPLFAAASGTLLSGADPADLANRMRTAELAAQPGRLPPLPDLTDSATPRTTGNK